MDVRRGMPARRPAPRPAPRPALRLLHPVSEAVQQQLMTTSRPVQLPMLHLDLLSAVRFNSGLRRDPPPKPVAPPRCLLCLSRGGPIIVLTCSGWACGVCTTLAVVLLQSRWRGALVRCALRRRRTRALLATVQSQSVMAAAWRAHLLARRQRAWRRWVSQQRRWSAMGLAARWQLHVAMERRRGAVRVWRLQAARLGRLAGEERLAHQLTRRQLAGAWGRWAEVADGSKGAEGAEAAARAITHALLLLRGWHGLLAALDDGCTRRRRWLGVAAWQRRTAARRAWRAWRVASARRARTEATGVAPRAARRAFAAWLGHAVARSTDHARRATLMTHASRRAATRALRAMAERSGPKRVLRSCGAQMALRLLHRELSRGWKRWVAQRQQAVRRRESLRRAQSHQVNRDLSAGWNSWAARAAERAASVRLLRKGLSYLVRGKLAPAFSSWRESIEASASAQHQRDSVSKGLRHLLHRELSRGWAGWVAQWQQAVRRRESLRRSLSHQVNRDLSAGWNSWAARAAERAAMLYLLRKGLSYFVRRDLAAGFASWRRESGLYAQDSVQGEAARLAARLGGALRGWRRAAHTAAQAALAVAALARRWVQRRRIRLAVRVWTAVVRGRRAAAHRLMAAGQAVGRRRVAVLHAVRAWRACTVARPVCRGLPAAALLLRSLRCPLRRALVCWARGALVPRDASHRTGAAVTRRAVLAQERRVERWRARRQRRQYGLGLAVWRSAARARALGALLLQVATAQRRRARASDAVRRWRYRTAARALAVAQPPVVLRLVLAGVGARRDPVNGETSRGKF